MSTSLHNKLESFVDTLTAAERDNYRLMLAIAAGQLAPAYDEAETPLRRAAFDAIRRSLRDVIAAELLYRGRPDFMTDELLHGMQKEAEERRATAKLSTRQWIGCGGKVADAFAFSPALLSFVSSLVPNGVEPTGIASYVYYDSPGAGIDPHADTDTFSLSVLIMLKHEWTEERSHLVLYPAGKPRERVPLAPGEVIVFDAAGMIHGRENVHDHETVHLLTIGFKRRAAQRLPS